MTAAVILSLALLDQTKPIDEATFLREATKGWAVLEKAYADIEGKYITLKDGGTRDEQSFARLGKRLRVERGDQMFKGQPPKNPGSSRAYVTDGNSVFVADRLAPLAPFKLLEYREPPDENDKRVLRLYDLEINRGCFAHGLRSWSDQIKRQGFAITRLESIKDGPRDLIRMEYREDDQPNEVTSIIKGWCHFDPNENYMPVEAETQSIQHATNYIFKTYIKIEYKESNAISNLRFIPSRATLTYLNDKSEVRATSTYDFETFAPCKLKPADFRPEAFGLETPR